MTDNEEKVREEIEALREEIEACFKKPKKSLEILKILYEEKTRSLALNYKKQNIMDKKTKANKNELKFDGYHLYTANNHKGDEIFMIKYPQDEGLSISKEKLIGFLNKLYEEEF